jgi:hypothetical protein
MLVSVLSALDECAAAAFAAAAAGEADAALAVGSDMMECCDDDGKRSEKSDFRVGY